MPKTPTVEALLRQLADQKAGIPAHYHHFGEDNQFACTSPYCEDLNADEPIGVDRKPSPEATKRYRREYA